MSNKKVLFVCVMIFALVISFSACGSKEAVKETGEETVTAEVQESTQQAVAGEVTPEEEVVEQVIATPEPGATVDSLIGSWIDVTSPDRFVNIAKTDTGYEYEDNEGKLPATFENGVLKVKVSDTETADIHIDADTGNLVSVYQDNISEYRKK